MSKPPVYIRPKRIFYVLRITDFVHGTMNKMRLLHKSGPQPRPISRVIKKRALAESYGIYEGIPGCASRLHREAEADTNDDERRCYSLCEYEE